MVFEPYRINLANFLLPKPCKVSSKDILAYDGLSLYTNDELDGIGFSEDGFYGEEFGFGPEKTLKVVIEKPTVTTLSKGKASFNFFPFHFEQY